MSNTNFIWDDGEENWRPHPPKESLHDPDKWNEKLVKIGSLIAKVFSVYFTWMIFIAITKGNLSGDLPSHMFMFIMITLFAFMGGAVFMWAHYKVLTHPGKQPGYFR